MNCLCFYPISWFCFILINLTSYSLAGYKIFNTPKKSHTSRYQSYINYGDDHLRKKYNHFISKLSETEERKAVDRQPSAKVAEFSSLLGGAITLIPPNKYRHAQNSFSRATYKVPSRPHNRKEILKSLLQKFHSVRPNVFRSYPGDALGRNSKNTHPESTASEIASSLDTSFLQDNSSMKRSASHDRANAKQNTISSASWHPTGQKAYEISGSPASYSNPKVDLGGNSNTAVIVMASSAGGLIAITSSVLLYLALRKRKLSASEEDSTDKDSTCEGNPPSFDDFTLKYLTNTFDSIEMSGYSDDLKNGIDNSDDENCMFFTTTNFRDSDHGSYDQEIDGGMRSGLTSIVETFPFEKVPCQSSKSSGRDVSFKRRQSGSNEPLEAKNRERMGKVDIGSSPRRTRAKTAEPRSLRADMEVLAEFLRTQQSLYAPPVTATRTANDNTPQGLDSRPNRVYFGYSNEHVATLPSPRQLSSPSIISSMSMSPRILPKMSPRNDRFPRMQSKVFPTPPVRANSLMHSSSETLEKVPPATERMMDTLEKSQQIWDINQSPQRSPKAYPKPYPKTYSKHPRHSVI